MVNIDLKVSDCYLLTHCYLMAATQELLSYACNPIFTHLKKMSLPFEPS